jgi:hypothetical protein
MKITIGTFELCGGAAKDEFPDGMTLDDSYTVQVRKLIRATAAKPINRGNRTVNVSFSVTREHGDHRAACEYALKHSADIPTIGDVVFVCEATGTTSLKLLNGTIQKHNVPQIIGCTTIHRYEIIGGEWQGSED